MKLKIGFVERGICPIYSGLQRKRRKRRFFGAFGRSMVEIFNTN